jgi:hypothetical protein
LNDEIEKKSIKKNQKNELSQPDQPTKSAT